nr:unnamed protein product [Callosobruchus analis]
MLEAVFDRTFSAVAVVVDVAACCACAALLNESVLRSLPLSESLTGPKEPFLDLGRLVESPLACLHDCAEWGRSPLRLRGPADWAGPCLPVSKAPSMYGTSLCVYVRW